MATHGASSFLFRPSILRSPALRSAARPALVPTRLTSSRTPPLARLASTDAAQSSVASSGPEAPDYLSDAELQIFNKLKQELEPSKLEVQDISGGCGSMYGLDIVSSRFKGLSVIKQHKLVNSVLAEEIKKWHGVQLKTKAP